MEQDLLEVGIIVTNASPTQKYIEKNFNFSHKEIVKL
jgi:hypothetical protein